MHGRGANRNNSRRPYISSFRHGGDLETRTAWNGTPPRILVNYCGVTSEVRLTRYWFLKHILLIPPMLLFGKKSQKKSPKMFKKLPKSGSSKHQWLTANAQLGTSFFGNLKNPAIFKFQNVGRPEHACTPLVSKHKNHVFSERTNGRTDEPNRTVGFKSTHQRKGRFAQ